MKPITPYKMEERDVEELDKILKNILLYCQIHKIPMFLSIATENNEKTTEYKNIVYTASAHNITLKNDKIAQHALIANGFVPTPPRNILEIGEEEGDLF